MISMIIIILALLWVGSLWVLLVFNAEDAEWEEIIRDAKEEK